MVKIVAIFACLILMGAQTQAKPRYDYYPISDRHALETSAPSWKSSVHRARPKSKAVQRQKNKKPSRKVSIATVVVPHPSGCPRVRFCGCGVSEKVYGKKVRSLYLAANWLKFPRTKAAPGMVAAKRGHVFYIIKVLGGNKVLAYDPNSGRRLTRIHVRSLAGFQVVNPKPQKLAKVDP